MRTLYDKCAVLILSPSSLRQFFLAAIAALYRTMSVCRSVRLSVGPNEISKGKRIMSSVLLHIVLMHIMQYAHYALCTLCIMHIMHYTHYALCTLCMMQYYAWCNIMHYALCMMHDAILCMMQYYSWCNIIHDAILCIIQYNSWSNIIN